MYLTLNFQKELFKLTIVFGIKSRSNAMYGKLKSSEHNITIQYDKDSFVFLNPKDVVVLCGGYSVMLIFDIGDIK